MTLLSISNGSKCGSNLVNTRGESPAVQPSRHTQEPAGSKNRERHRGTSEHLAGLVLPTRALTTPPRPVVPLARGDLLGPGPSTVTCSQGTRTLYSPQKL